MEGENQDSSSSYTSLLRDLICEKVVSSVFLPLQTFITPYRINVLIVCLFTKSFTEWIDELTLQMAMPCSSSLSSSSTVDNDKDDRSNHNNQQQQQHSFCTSNQLSLSSSSSTAIVIPSQDDGYQYLAISLTRFHAETILLRAPIGSFIFRRSHPYSSFIYLSYGKEVKRMEGEKEKKQLVIVHEAIEVCSKRDVNSNSNLSSSSSGRGKKEMENMDEKESGDTTFNEDEKNMLRMMTGKTKAGQKDQREEPELIETHISEGYYCKYTNYFKSFILNNTFLCTDS